jgi:hypothetical protein
LHVEVKPAKKSHVKGFESGLLLHVPMAGRLLPVQLTGVPAWQPVEGLHTSWPLQKSPSLHAALFAVCVHESVASLQASVVQETESPQLGAVPA